MGYLKFEEFIPMKPRKTKMFDIIHNEDGDCIGSISWRASWRQYTSRMGSDVDVSAGCHREIAGFIDKLMEDRK